MDYKTLPPQAFGEMRVNRLQELEAEHYRVTLRGEEVAVSGEELTAVESQLADLERRIAVHRAVLEPPAETAPDPDEQDSFAPHADTGPESAPSGQ